VGVLKVAPLDPNGGQRREPEASALGLIEPQDAQGGDHAQALARATKAGERGLGGSFGRQQNLNL
jgi:hypothetical protein